MAFQPHPYVLPLAVSAIISGIAAIAAWHRRHVRGAAPLAMNMLGLMLWSGAYACLWASATESGQVFWGRVMYVGVCMTPLSFLVFVARITKLSWLKPRHIVRLSLLPILSLFLVWTNNLHHLFVISTNLFINNGLLEIEWVRGPWWWVNFAYSYGLVAGGVVILLREIKRASMLLRPQLITVLVGALIPWAANIFTQFWFTRLGNLDLTPIAFSISSFFFAYAIFTQRLFDILPIARNVVVEKMLDGIVVMDSQLRLIDINPAAEKMFGVNAKEILGRDGAGIFPQWVDIVERVRKTGREFHADVQGKDNPEWRYDLTITSFEINQSNGGYLVISRDIMHHWNARTGLQGLNSELEAKLGEINALQTELREQAIRDALTGVYNRRFLDETLQTAIKQAMNENLPLSIVMLDIDHFKEINDIYGHKAGDLILQELANKTQTAIRDGDLVCRFGGDEFVIILPNVSKKVANQRAEQVRKNIEEILVDYKSIQLKVTSSMGIAVYPEHGSNADLLLRAADKALYAAKLAGRNRVTIFDPDGDMNTVRLNMPPR